MGNDAAHRRRKDAAQLAVALVAGRGHEGAGAVSRGIRGENPGLRGTVDQSLHFELGRRGGSRGLVLDDLDGVVEPGGRLGEAAFPEAHLGKGRGGLPQHAWPRSLGENALVFLAWAAARHQVLRGVELEGGEAVLDRHLEAAASSVGRDLIDEAARLRILARSMASLNAGRAQRNPGRTRVGGPAKPRARRVARLRRNMARHHETTDPPQVARHCLRSGVAAP